MNCDELRDHYDLYALDIAEEPERSEIRSHLHRSCEVCMAGIKRSLETVTLIGASAPWAEPSRQLRRRVLASVGLEERAGIPWWAAALAMAALVVVSVYLGVSSKQYEETAGRLRTEIRAQTAQIASLTEAFAILSGPNTTEASFGGAQPMPPQGKVFLNPARGVLLIAHNLPRTPVNKIYEMWIIPKGAKPVPAGLFQSQDGRAMHVQPGSVDVARTAAVAVTVEDQAGADQPTTQPVIVAAVPAAPR
ncbi:MAG TPA: anti-sigma factor [Bryobacteraceae bacterium]|nr:anti-sigma factor [Bryobacteraceae bacterium]